MQSLTEIAYSPVLALGAYVELVSGNWTLLSSEFDGLCTKLVAGSGRSLQNLQLQVRGRAARIRFGQGGGGSSAGVSGHPLPYLQLEPFSYFGAIYPPTASQAIVNNPNYSSLGDVSRQVSVYRCACG